MLIERTNNRRIKWRIFSTISSKIIVISVCFFSAFLLFFSSVRFPKSEQLCVCLWSQLTVIVVYFMNSSGSGCSHKVIAFAPCDECHSLFGLVLCVCVCRTPNHLDVFAQCACTLFSVLSSLNSDFNALPAFNFERVAPRKKRTKINTKKNKMKCVCVSVCVWQKFTLIFLLLLWFVLCHYWWWCERRM